jgi:predicted nucleic acid-binding protein
MNVVDSSGWLEYFANSRNADFFTPAIENTVELIVPSISIYEVFKRVLQQRDEHEALQAVAVMAQGHVVNLNTSLALNAARLSVDLQLPMADSIILAIARTYDAILWTQDIDFENIDGVRYIQKKDAD